MVVCPINKNHLNRCFTKSFGRGQPAEAPTHNHHAGCARFPGVTFRHRDVIRFRHRSVLFFYFFLKLLSAQISKNLLVSWWILGARDRPGSCDERSRCARRSNLQSAAHRPFRRYLTRAARAQFWSAKPRHDSCLLRLRAAAKQRGFPWPNQATTLSATGNWRLLRPSWRTFDRKETRDCGTNRNRVDSTTVLLTVENDGCVNQPALLAKRLGIEAVLLQKFRAPICIRGTPEASMSRPIGNRL